MLKTPLTCVNLKKLCRIACIFLILFFSQGNALAATIHGTVYEWYSFKPLNNTVIEVNSTPEQYYVATDANYSFNLTPGTYTITADYFEEKTLVYAAREKVVISGEGEYIHDLLLFPTYEEELLSQSGLEVPDQSFNQTQPVSQPDPPKSYLVSAFLAFLAFVVVTLLGVYTLSYYLKKRNKKPPEIIGRFSGGNGFSGRNEDIKELKAGNSIKEAEFSEAAEDNSAENHEESEDGSAENLDESEDDSAENLDESFEIISKLPASTDSEAGDSQEDRKANLPEDLRELLDLIRNSGNRITQRELRKKSPYSESKVSLMLSDLEERGLIEKFKRGRGNVIRIPDEHVSKQTEYESKQE